MIVSKRHDFGFVHIPKNAGSTIRHQLREHDDFGGRFYQTIEVPGHGRVNGNHLPLYFLAEHFPEALAALAEVTSYTVLRDPLERFASALAQRIRGVLKRDPGSMHRAEIAAEVDVVLAGLEAMRGFPEGSLLLFVPQVDFIELDGARRIDRLIPIERMDLLFDALERVHGLPLERESVWNPTVTYRDPRLAGPLNRMKKIARRRLPVRQYAALRDVAVGLFTKKGAEEIEEAVAGSPKVVAFVRDYYARDRALHRAAQAEAENSAQPKSATISS